MESKEELMRIFYHRLMARFYFKWNKKGFQKHIDKLLDALQLNFYYMVKHAPDRVLKDTETFESEIRLIKNIRYKVGVKIEHVQQLIKDIEDDL